MAGRRGPQVRFRGNGVGRSRSTWVFLALTLLTLTGVWWWLRPVKSAANPAANEAIGTPAPALLPASNIVVETRRVSAGLPNTGGMRSNKMPTNSAVVRAPTQHVPLSFSTAPGSEPLPEGVPNPPGPNSGSAFPTNWLLAQIALAAYGISPGPIDGVGGAQSIMAVRAFQAAVGLEANGRLERDTIRALKLSGPPFAEFTVTAAQLGRLRPIPKTWIEKSEVSALDFEDLPELVGELTHTQPNLLRRLNPTVDWLRARPGLRLTVPSAEFPPARRAALIRISLRDKWLRVFDEAGQLLAHFPCSIGARVETRPVGALAVAVAVKNPNYTFNPATFPESTEAQAIGHKLILPPGPNNPVGVAWIGLTRLGYGIHGTPRPEQVGRTESHGCFRLANWDAEYLRQMCWPGLPVRVEQ